MTTRQDSFDARFQPETLRSFSDYLSRAARPGTRLPAFLDGLLRIFHTRYPEITRAEIFLRATDGTYRRAAGIGIPADAPETPPPASGASRALAANDLIAPDASSGPAVWAIPLPGGDGVIGVLSIELPADSPASSTLGDLLLVLALPLGLAVELVQAIPLTRALAISRKLPSDCTPADIVGAFVNYLADDVYLPISLTLIDYEHERPVRARTFHRAHPGDGITSDPAIPVTEHPFEAAVPDLTRGQPVIIPDVYTSPLIAAAAHEWFRAQQITALTLIPLAAHDRLAGMLALGGLLPDSHPLAGLQTLADQIAVLVQNRALSERAAHALAQTSQRVIFEGALNAITARFQQQTDLRDLLQQTMRDLGHALGARRVRVRLQPHPGPNGAQSPQQDE